MDTAFERGAGTAPLLLASSIPQLTSPKWRFSLLIGVTDLTVSHYGGMSATETLIRDQIKVINDKFNNPKVFNAIFDFYIYDIYHFGTDPVAESLKSHWPHDYRMVYDGYPAPGQGGGWMGQKYNSIYHLWYVSHMGGTFGATATDGLAHEFGHARGAIDLYKLAVTAANNPVNGQAYAPPQSIMNYSYGVNVWDAHSINIINENTDVVTPNISYITKAFPPSFSILATDSGGKPRAGVTINLYPVDWNATGVAPAPTVTGQTDAAGRVTLAKNPFDPAQPGQPWDIRYCNFLVEAQLGSAKRYAWMPLDDVQNAYFKLPKTAYTLTLTI